MGERFSLRPEALSQNFVGHGEMRIRPERFVED